MDRRDEFSVRAGAAVVRVEDRTIKVVVVYYDGRPLGRVNCLDVKAGGSDGVVRSPSDVFDGDPFFDS